jgi:hypothetical protein
MLTRRSFLGGLLAAPALVRLDALDFGRPRLILPPKPPQWDAHGYYIQSRVTFDEFGGTSIEWLKNGKVVQRGGWIYTLT